MRKCLAGVFVERKILSLTTSPGMQKSAKNPPVVSETNQADKKLTESVRVSLSLR